MARWRRATELTGGRRDPFGRLFVLTTPVILGLLALAVALGPDAAPTWTGGVGRGVPGGQTAIVLVLLDAVATTLLIAAGCSAILRWRLSRERVSLHVGLAMIILGALWLVPTGVVGPAFELDAARVAGVGTFGLLAGAGFLVLGLRQPPRLRLGQVSGSRRWRWLVVLAAVALGVVISASARPSVVSSIDLAERTALFVFAANGSLYLLVGHRQRRWLHGWVGLGLMTFSYAELLAAFSGGRMTFLVAAGLLRFIGAGVVLNGVTREMIDAYVAQQQRLFGAVLNLQAIEIGKARTQAREAEIRHDLRSGLMAIQAAMAAFGRTRADSEYLSGTTLTEAVSAEIKRLWSLTDRAGDGEPVVHDLAASLAPAIACHGALLDLEASVPEGLMLRGQPDALVGAIVNLLANARTHAPGATVRLIAARVGPFVEIEVADDGPGVADDVRPRLFDRGFTTRPDGTGLGLDIALQLTRSQGGDLFCDRTEVGARFRMVLPAAPDPSEESTIDLTEPSEAPS